MRPNGLKQTEKRVESLEANARLHGEIAYYRCELDHSNINKKELMALQDENLPLKLKMRNETELNTNMTYRDALQHPKPKLPPSAVKELPDHSDQTKHTV